MPFCHKTVQSFYGIGVKIYEVCITSDEDYYSFIGHVRNKMGSIRSKINTLRPSTIKNIREGSGGDVVCPEWEDPRSDRYGAFVVNKALPIYLCPSWFVDLAVDMQAAVLIHETGHLIGFSDVQYIKLRKGKNPPSPSCGKYGRFTIEQKAAVDNPDSYAYFATDFIRLKP